MTVFGDGLTSGGSLLRAAEREYYGARRGFSTKSEHMFAFRTSGIQRVGWFVSKPKMCLLNFYERRDRL